MKESQVFNAYRQAALYIQSKLKEKNVSSPIIGIVCGSGLGGLSESLTNTYVIPYNEIPGFPPTTVAGHKGEIVFGNLSSSSIPTACFRGRFHSYEGHDMNIVALPVRVMRCIGIKLVLLTNAAGGLNPDYNVGDIVNVMDHFAIPMMAGNNPLIGRNDEELGPRFPPTSNAYDDSLQTDIVLEAAKSLSFDSFVRPNGTYCFVSGPNYESRAECKFLRSLGGDSVGMSTVPEIITAHHTGMKVICLSLITNKVVIEGNEGPPASHQEVLDAVEKRSEQMQTLVQTIVMLLKTKGVLDSFPDLKPIDCSTQLVN